MQTNNLYIKSTVRYTKRVLGLTLSLIATSLITFSLIRATPGDPFQEEQPIPKEILEGLHEYYGLNKPWYEQYMRFASGAIKGDLGPSYKYEGRQVTDIIAESFPISLKLGLGATIIALFGGVLCGSFIGYYPKKRLSYLLNIGVIFGLSLPSFLQASYLQYVFGVYLQWLPIARWGDISHMILPTLSLSILPLAYITKLTSESITRTLREDYVTLAKCKGLPSYIIFIRYVLPNSLPSVIAYIGPMCAAIFTGSFVVEKIFGIPGLGGWFVKSVVNRDYTLIMGVSMFYCVILLVMNFLSELLLKATLPQSSKEDA